MLHHLASQAAEAGAPVLQDNNTGDWSEALRIVQIALEVGTTGRTVERAVDRLISQGRVAALLELLKAKPPAGAAVADAIVAQLVAPSSLATLVNREPMDEASLDGLLPFMSAEGFQALLDVLASSENRATRRKLIDRLARAALDTGPYIAARLEDERWYVLRNMLLLMERSGHIPEGFSADALDDAPGCASPLRSAAPAADHCARTRPRGADGARRRGSAHHPARPRHTAAGLPARVCAAGVGDGQLIRWPIPKCACSPINALSRLKDAAALDTLLKVVDGGRTLFGRQKLAAKTPVVIAALRALAHAWADEPRATAMLKRGVQSADAEVRQASQHGES